MGHDEHFLRRLDRVRRDHVEFALGLYRDHEFVRHLLTNVELHLPADAERVALSLEDGGEGPHVIVARNGHFVTCLGKGMLTHSTPVVSRAQIDALAASVERVREGLALARRRGLDAKRAVSKLEKAGPALSREDFVATAALLGPATTVLTETYAGCLLDLDETLPLLLRRDLDAHLRREWTREVAEDTWGMAHAALMHVDNASREWVEQWAELPAHRRGSPWQKLVATLQVPFIARAAWIAARLGKTFLPFYAQRYAAPNGPLDFFDAAWGLFAMAVRHEPLRAEAVAALKSRGAKAHGDGGEPGLEGLVGALLAGVAGAIGTPDEARLAAQARETGRKVVVATTAHLPPGSAYRFAEEGAVPDELALPAFLELPVGLTDHLAEGLATTTAAVLASARLRAEEFYLPARFLHARGPVDLQDVGAGLVRVMREVLMSDKTVRREGPRVGRNEPCPCGSGKKYKRCCGG